MGSFKELQEILPLCLEDEIIDDEEFILLYEAYMPQNPSFPHSSYGKFSIVKKKKTWPNVRPIFAWRREISPYLLKRYESLLFSNVPMEQFAMELKVYA